jgi:hypothetical protein
MKRLPGERGGALVIVLILMVALLGGGATALYLANQDTRVAGLVKGSRTSLYCAEAGLRGSRTLIALHMAEWPLLIDGDDRNDPAWYPPRGDLDGDGVADWEVRVRDNDDERSPEPNDPTVDLDLQLFAVARCLANPEIPRELLELVSFEGAGNLYRDQSGQGSGNTGNAN